MKTPDEIKNALECCAEISVCSECPYYNKLKFGGECVEIKSIDALNYIRQLENHIGELTEKVTQLEAAQPKWISVEERLPDCLEDVIAFNQNGDIRWFSVASVDRGTWWRDGKIVHHVTHWMPLPEPPKEE